MFKGWWRPAWAVVEVTETITMFSRPTTKIVEAGATVAIMDTTMTTV